MCLVELAAAFGGADMNPVSGFVAGGMEAVGLHESLQQDGSIVISFLPV